MTIYINPGSGPVAGADLMHAETNMATFLVDVATKRGVTFQSERKPDLDERGRFGFRIFIEGEQHEVEMPGLPLAEVRWMDDPDQNIWDFPRLYVDGDSWVWKYAIDIEPDEDES